jgi:hypothetical protein
MKKLLFLVAVLIGYTIARGQSASMGLASTSFAPTALTTALPVAARLNANKTVYKDFTLYRYSADGINYKLYYNNRGAWHHSILSYDGASLPASIQDEIRTVYNNYNISWVDELRYPDQAAVYRVQLKKGKKLVIVQVNEDEMEKEAEYEQ